MESASEPLSFDPLADSMSVPAPPIWPLMLRITPRIDATADGAAESMPSAKPSTSALPE